MNSILQASHLVKKADFAAVNDISFEIEEGEIFSLLGPNGAGKTTTISMFSTLIAATSGDAPISGHSVKRELMGCAS
jgi:ABC-type multidrug transport system ATPase subunit